MRGSGMNLSGSFGSLADILRCPDHVRFVPEADTCSALGDVRFVQTAAFGVPDSITSSALVSSADGIVMPSAFADFRLITSSNLIGCSTGRSAGVAPRKILST